MLLWCVWLQKHILYSGDLEFLKKMMPQLKRLLVFVENLAGDESVLLGFEDGEDALPCLLDDDQKMDRLGVSTALNCLYCYALLKCEWMFQLLEEDSYVDYCHGLANEIAKTLRRICWDDKKNLFVDTFDQGERSEHCSMQTNILAMLSGVASEKMSNRIQGQMFLDYAPYLKMEYDFENESAYFKYFILETIYNIGDSSWATDYIRYYWGKMIEYNADTWWEKFSPSLHDGVEYTDPPSSACNGYGVSANYFIMSEIVGIRPVAENFKQIYLSPQIVDLEWCSASLPTPHGVIKVEWNFRESGELVFSIDANYELEVVPQFDASLVATDTIMKIGDSVNILQ